jgi:predicted DNA-binding protein with PD1-like motif
VIDSSQQQKHILRLLPGGDLRMSVERYLHLHQLEAAWMVTAAGSLTAYRIRMANRNKAANGFGFFEILSVTGTLSIYGVHLHICIADAEGNAIGGHLMEGCIIYTTAELVLESSDILKFTREQDGAYKELKISEKKNRDQNAP